MKRPTPSSLLWLPALVLCVGCGTGSDTVVAGDEGDATSAGDVSGDAGGDTGAPDAPDTSGPQPLKGPGPQNLACPAGTTQRTSGSSWVSR
ncbi:MAG: hypothetical protein KC502_19135, partial [Myxococcales bacterium]|nr:hypothetical protein [Myxococcales bacterium]